MDTQIIAKLVNKKEINDKEFSLWNKGGPPEEEEEAVVAPISTKVLKC